MINTRVILGTVAVALASGLAVYAAQHQTTSVHTAPPMFAAFHESCGSGQGHAATTTEKSHVPTHLAQALELTAAQLADIDRMSAELCQAITKAHKGMMNVLTPQQRTKIAELHGGDHPAGGLHALLRRLHGGK
jgi:hypothetical protein